MYYQSHKNENTPLRITHKVCNNAIYWFTMFFLLKSSDFTLLSCRNIGVNLVHCDHMRLQRIINTIQQTPKEGRVDDTIVQQRQMD